MNVLLVMLAHLWPCFQGLCSGARLASARLAGVPN